MNVVGKAEISVDQTKVVKHPEKVERLELWLDNYSSIFTAYINVPGWNMTPIKRWDSQAKAKAEFAKMVGAVKRGDYRLDLYEGGRVEVQVRY
jgi:hypothetical protein